MPKVIGVTCIKAFTWLILHFPNKVTNRRIQTHKVRAPLKFSLRYPLCCLEGKQKHEVTPDVGKEEGDVQGFVFA